MRELVKFYDVLIRVPLFWGWAVLLVVYLWVGTSPAGLPLWVHAMNLFGICLMISSILMLTYEKVKEQERLGARFQERLTTNPPPDENGL